MYTYIKNFLVMPAIVVQQTPAIILKRLNVPTIVFLWLEPLKPNLSKEREIIPFESEDSVLLRNENPKTAHLGSIPIQADYCDFSTCTESADLLQVILKYGFIRTILVQGSKPGLQ